jgi:hypothetical protein
LVARLAERTSELITIAAMPPESNISPSLVGKLKRRTRHVLEGTAIGRHALKSYGLWRLNRLAASYGNAKALFTHIYETNLWDGTESVSGPGSTAACTENLRRELPALMLRLDARRILDAPCGDFNWFRLVNLPFGVTYIGGDIVEPLVARNTALYGDAKRSFQVMDIRRDPLPASDLWICRDVLFHLSNADVYAVLRNFLNNDISYFLVTTHPERGRNRDIPTGSWRRLNLEREPFFFPPPLARIDDRAEGLPAREMCLWGRDQIARVVGATPAKFCS